MKSNLLKIAAFCALSMGTLVFYGCTSCTTSSVAGTYTDPGGSVILELKSGGRANLTFMGDTADCTYSSGKQQVTLKCAGDAGTTVFTVHDDGFLTGPQGGMMPALHKQK